MRDRTLTFIGSLVLATAAAAWLATGSLAAQAPKAPAKPMAKPAAKPWTAPRTADGKPDLSGLYDVATMTPVERPAGIDRLVLTPQEAAAMEKYEYERQVKNDAPINADRATRRIARYLRATGAHAARAHARPATQAARERRRDAQDADSPRAACSA